jgi:hypothetical protein
MLIYAVAHTDFCNGRGRVTIQLQEVIVEGWRTDLATN